VPRIIARGIERAEIFRDDQDRDAFLWFGPAAFIEYKNIKGVPAASHSRCPQRTAAWPPEKEASLHEPSLGLGRRNRRDEKGLSRAMAPSAQKG